MGSAITLLQITEEQSIRLAAELKGQTPIATSPPPVKGFNLGLAIRGVRGKLLNLSLASRETVYVIGGLGLQPAFNEAALPVVRQAKNWASDLLMSSGLSATKAIRSEQTEKDGRTKD